MKEGTASIMGDYTLRKDSGEIHHHRNHKAKYKNVDMRLFHQTRSMDQASYCGIERNQTTWTNRALIKAAKPGCHMKSTNGGSKLVVNTQKHWYNCCNPEIRKPLRGFYRGDVDDDIEYARNGEDRCDYCDNFDKWDYPADTMFSFDRTTGPSRGSDILSQALNKAVVKFETKQFDKLVKDEYDIVSSDESNSEDDEYEMV